MNRQINALLTSLVVANSLISGTVSAQTGTIANWKELNTGSTNSGMNTASPTIGDGSANNADDAWVAGRFGTVATPATVTLAIGETLTVSGTVILTGGSTAASNLRFGVFDESVNQTYTANDITTSLFTYNAVGILFGGSLDLDQGVLSGVQYTVAPSGPSIMPKITSLSISDNSATVVMKGAPGTDYYCAGSGDLTDWTTEVVPTDTPGSPFQTHASGDLTFTVDISSFGSSYFLRVQDTDPNP